VKGDVPGASQRRAGLSRRLVRRSAGVSRTKEEGLAKAEGTLLRPLPSTPFLPEFIKPSLLEIIRAHHDPKFDTGIESEEPRLG
jgi:hypothetical protein